MMKEMEIEPLTEAYAITLEERAVNEKGELAPAKIVFSENGFIDIMSGDVIYFRFDKTDLEVIRKISTLVSVY